MEQTPTPHRSSPRCIAIVGMNGVGKSRFGKGLASKLQRKRIDTDSEFRKLHGPEADYIRSHGWEAFRRAEEEIICASLQPGRIVIIGGGGVESPTVRAALKERALVLWLQGGKGRIHTNLTRAKVARPEFMEGLTSSDVGKLLQDRLPLYEEVADVRLPPHLRFSEQIPTALALLRARTA